MVSSISSCLGWYRVVLSALLFTHQMHSLSVLCQEEEFDEEPRGAPMVSPGCNSAYEMLRQQPQKFSVMKSAVDATGLNSVLDDSRLMATVFLPTDDAFIDVLESIKGQTSSLGDSMTPELLLTDLMFLHSIVKNHVVPYFNDNIENFEAGECYETMVSGECIKIVDENGTRHLQSSGAASLASFITTNANSGCPTIFHWIDKLLLPTL